MCIHTSIDPIVSLVSTFCLKGHIPELMGDLGREAGEDSIYQFSDLVMITVF